jgi:hypothetical protein
MPGNFMFAGKLHERLKRGHAQLGCTSHRHPVFAEQFQRNKLGRFMGHVTLIELGSRNKIGGQFKVLSSPHRRALIR